ncbi:MAG: type 2 isopentenyl-diphosphate Delta-isomerase [Nitrososphaerota archaeon]|jgi:isopentenyl-diphosphate delta-isomerase|nr:type 2 isopentenyl-diphosphate Delta-isomerase [Nitrososphaerota archaeon]
MVKSQKSDKKNFDLKLLGLKVYSYKGNLIGHIIDITIYKNKVIFYILTDTGRIKIIDENQILNAGEAVILRNDALLKNTNKNFYSYALSDQYMKLALNDDLKHRYNYWEDIRLVHCALPEINFDEIETSTILFGKKLDYPIIIEGMVGGTEASLKINENLARVAEKFNIGMEVGSERSALKRPEMQNSFKVLKNYNIPLRIGNLGALDLIYQGFGDELSLSDLENAMNLVDADILALYLSYAPETVRPSGRLKAKGVEKALENISSKYPILIKETGFGISRELALRLKKLGIKSINVSGAGGTSFTAIEYQRIKNRGYTEKEELGKIFWNWGIPAPASIYHLRDLGLTIIGSGGLNNGMDLAKAIVLGADAGGYARTLLKPALVSYKNLEDEIKKIIAAFKVAMFLTNSKNINELKKRQFVSFGKTKEWIEQIKH